MRRVIDEMTRLGTIITDNSIHPVNNSGMSEFAAGIGKVIYKAQFSGYQRD
jgi:hypothetical protein